MLDKLYQLDKKVESLPYYYSLDPLRVRANKPSKLAQLYLPKQKSQTFYDKMSNLMTKLFISQYENFPSNIFWDMDFLICHLFSHTNEAEIDSVANKVIKLNERYGKNNLLNFSYTHDFIYGFDWCRWVRKDYENKKNIGPFHMEFLDYLDKRSLELFSLIDTNDKKYPKLNKEEPRNPFNFQRTPKIEIKLHLKLAEQDNIPLKAWQSTYNLCGLDKKNYSLIREECAKELQLQKS